MPLTLSYNIDSCNALAAGDGGLAEVRRKYQCRARTRKQQETGESAGRGGTMPQTGYPLQQVILSM